MASTLLNPELSNESAMSLLPEVEGLAGLLPRPDHENASPKTSELIDGPVPLPDSPLHAVNGKTSQSEDTHMKKKRPLQLLDLPLDILKEIVKEITHTNDLTSLALTHSSLHDLAVPYIYSRFDIVWPESHPTNDPRSGVDALTYGLATLVMGEEIFGEAPSQQQYYEARGSSMCQKCGQMNIHERPACPPPAVMRKRRRGNHYAQYTRKFSIGNGPSDWVQEYGIGKEGGKMLGTLIALAIARMPNLEVFTWDMPTGILRDVWLALSSLAERRDGSECRLERVWVRWHDNNEALVVQESNQLHAAQGGTTTMPHITHGVTSANSPGLVNALMHSHHHNPLALLHVEHPTLSCLPALKSLSTLDIDELPYLDEMSVLIRTSQHRLRELRIGISKDALKHPWAVGDWEGDLLEQVDHGAGPSGISSMSLSNGKRLGGVLGIIVGRIHDIRKKRKRIPVDLAISQKTVSNLEVAETSHVEGPLEAAMAEAAATLGGLSMTDTGLAAASQSDHITEDPADDHAMSASSSEHSVAESQPSTTATAATAISTEPSPMEALDDSAGVEEDGRPRLDGKLKLEILELERVSLSIRVLQKAFDWTTMTTLTILSCPHHELLWKMLKRTFTPRAIHRSTMQSVDPQNPRLSRLLGTNSRTTAKSPAVPMEYQLRLKKVYANQVSPALIAFLKETLAPNSLEILFLQESQDYASAVTIDAIYRGPIRRHKGSLKKLLVDSSLKSGVPGGTTAWKKWVFHTELLKFVTSGQMPALRELGMALDYKNWHEFLTRLPMIPHLRSLYLPNVADYVHATPDAREMALQILDIITLCPQVEICYMGILTKCFEVLENRNTEELWPGIHTVINLPPPPAVESEDGSEDEDDVDEDEDAGVEDLDDDADPSDSDGEMDLANDSEDEFEPEAERSRIKLRLREILFYDDKVAIFKARHGRL